MTKRYEWTEKSGSGGTSDYNDLTNKPSVNGTTLSGNKTGPELGVSNVYKLGDGLVHGLTSLIPNTVCVPIAIDFSGLIASKFLGSDVESVIYLKRYYDAGNNLNGWLFSMNYVSGQFLGYLNRETPAQASGDSVDADPGISVFTYTVATQELVYDPAFLAAYPNKIVPIKSFDSHKDATTIIYSLFGDERAAMIANAIKYQYIDIDCEYLYEYSTGSTNYNNLDNKPSINGQVLTGDKTLYQLNIAPRDTTAQMLTDLAARDDDQEHVLGDLTEGLGKSRYVKSDVHEVSTAIINNWLTEVAGQPSLVSATFDFSALTEPFLHVTYDLLGSLAPGANHYQRGPNTSPSNVISIQSLDAGLADEFYECWVNGSLAVGDPTNVVVFRYYVNTRVLEWGEAFQDTKIYQFNTFDPNPEDNSIRASAYQSPSFFNIVRFIFPGDSVQRIDCKWLYENQGSGNYNDLSNKPAINNVSLVGNQAPAALGLATKSALDNLVDTIEMLQSDLGQIRANKSDIFHTDPTMIGMPDIAIGTDFVGTMIDFSDVDVSSASPGSTIRLVRYTNASQTYYVFAMAYDATEGVLVAKVNCWIINDNPNELLGGTVVFYVDLSRITLVWGSAFMFYHTYTMDATSFTPSPAYHTLVSIETGVVTGNAMYNSMRFRDTALKVDCEYNYNRIITHETAYPTITDDQIAAGVVGTHGVVYKYLGTQPFKYAVWATTNSACAVGYTANIFVGYKSHNFICDTTIVWATDRSQYLAYWNGSCAKATTAAASTWFQYVPGGSPYRIIKDFSGNLTYTQLLTESFADIFGFLTCWISLYNPSGSRLFRTQVLLQGDTGTVLARGAPVYVTFNSLTNGRFLSAATGTNPIPLGYTMNACSGVSASAVACIVTY